ncbi:MAG: SRPBCC domain-containing protein [Ilumatobacteraceae bacterium]
MTVEGTPEEVWRAIATGPGISSWYVPHEVEEQPGGRATASFGPGPELQIPGRVAAWEPPHRIVFTGEDPNDSMAFEWLVEARDGGSCVVRLVNSGFGTGEEWDAQYDGLQEGWQLFLLNLQLHLRHFRGQDARSILPLAMRSGTQGDVWAELLRALGLPESPEAGQHIRTAGDAGARRDGRGRVAVPSGSAARRARAGNRIHRGGVHGRPSRGVRVVLPLRRPTGRDRRTRRTALASVARRGTDRAPERTLGRCV